MNLRNPAWVIIGLLQPVLYLLLFGPLLKPLVEQFGGRERLHVPGSRAARAAGHLRRLLRRLPLIGEWRDGVIEAERVTPASRTALLVGRLCATCCNCCVQALVLVALGYAMGMEAPLGGASSVSC